MAKASENKSAEKPWLFKKGVSGNPGGRPKGIAQMRELAQGHTEASVKALVKALKHEDARVQIAAAHELLDRGWGKAAQPLAGEDGEGPVVIQIVKYTGGENV